MHILKKQFRIISPCDLNCLLLQFNHLKIVWLILIRRILINLFLYYNNYSSIRNAILNVFPIFFSIRIFEVEHRFSNYIKSDFEIYVIQIRQEKAM